MGFTSESACLQVRTSSTWSYNAARHAEVRRRGICRVTSAFAEDMSFIEVLS